MSDDRTTSTTGWLWREVGAAVRLYFDPIIWLWRRCKR